MRPALIIASMVLLAAGGFLRTAASQSAGTYVDDAGVWRWSDGDGEIALFGVNYSTPFAYAYRAHERRGVSHEDAIDADVAHMARLGFDAYRVHVWDREVSDGQGNLVENDHLRLLDYLISRLKERDIKILLTPIAWWGNGWPEPDTQTPGFSNNYSRAELATDPSTLPIQTRYLRQFVEHMNPYTGLSYRDDPSIIAIELFNEPRHPEPPEKTTAYVDRLIASVRSTGFEKPIFYNVSQNWSTEHAAAIAASKADGVSFQWYPAGLVRGRGIRVNALPHVDRYPIPSEQVEGFDRKARMVYEFDAADVLGSYIYPAMARSFREAGMQWATQFSYDPLAIADENTEYSTHYVNLVYAPSKALSLMIAAEAFRRLPRGVSHGRYPNNTRFGDARVSYEEDLSEYLGSERFYYSNSTSTVPPAPDSLEAIAGYGSSPLVEYGGTGAYFLDKLADGTWRLEVFPDAVWERDPYGPTTTRQPVSRLVWRGHDMSVKLEDLSEAFTVSPVNDGNSYSTEARDGEIHIEPGVYLLQRPDAGVREWEADSPFLGGELGDFYVPQPVERPESVVSTPPSEVVDGEPLAISAKVVDEHSPDRVSMYLRHVGSGWFERYPMEAVGAYDYAAEVRSRQVRSGLLEYFVVTEQGGMLRSYPGGVAGHPSTWDFPGMSGWTVPVVARDAPALLFDAQRDYGKLYYPHEDNYVSYDADLVAGSEPHRLAVQGRVESLAPAPHHFALQVSTVEHMSTIAARREGFDAIVVRLRALEPSTREVTVAVITADGRAWGANVAVSLNWQDARIKFEDLRPISRVLLPRPYPTFLPYRFDGSGAATRSVASTSLDPATIEAIEFSIDGTDGGNGRDAAHGFEIERVLLLREAR